jgi:dolichol kinase
MAAVGFGDGLAPIIGTYLPWGYYNYSIFDSSGNDVKTLSGSLGVFVGTILGIFLIRYVTGVPEELHAGIVIGVALVATVAEGVSGKWDNPVIAFSVLIFLRAKMASTT